MDVCLEPDFSIEPPDILKDPEHTPTRKPLIEPVKPVIHDKRKQQEKLCKPTALQRILIQDSDSPAWIATIISVLEKPVSLFLHILQHLDKSLSNKIMK